MFPFTFRAKRKPTSGTVRVEPVRVKVYGLFWQSRRRYVIQAILELGYAVGLLILWWLKLRPMCQSMMKADVELPPYMWVFIAVLNELPWILLIATAIKAFEMWIILRRFTEKEAEQLAKKTNTSP
jgi:hypothetical protein